MLKVIAIFVLLTISFGLSITSVRHMTGQEIWSVAKTLGFSLICALLTLVVMSVIVILF